MIEINRDGFSFEVDTEKTKHYYSNTTPCECEYCRNYYSHISNMFPKIEAFLSEFGIDITKPDNTTPVEADGKIVYSPAGYTVCGRILNAPNERITIRDTADIELIFYNGYAFPNEQSGDYFSVSLYNITIPINKP